MKRPLGAIAGFRSIPAASTKFPTVVPQSTAHQEQLQFQTSGPQNPTIIGSVSIRARKGTQSLAPTRKPISDAIKTRAMR